MITGPWSAFWSTGSQWELLPPLALALVLSAVIGVEREVRAKSAGLRTHTLVGLGAAAFMIVSKYGFADLLGVEHIGLDPSRIAAQIVSGIGFLGGGLIFVRQDIVRGLTTAATVWLVAAVGAAAGAGLPLLAVAATLGHLLITTGFPPLARAVTRLRRQPPTLHLSYFDGRGVLRTVLASCTAAGWTVSRVEVTREGVAEGGEHVAAVRVQLDGRGDVNALAAELAELAGVRSASSGPDGQLDE